MVRDIPLEYLHLILYGAMKRLLNLWVDGTKAFKFSNSDVLEISKKHVQAGYTKPTEINRSNRSLKCLSFWKATEFRTFLLKTGPVILRDHLTLEMYNHFLLLHCAVSICCTERFLTYLPVAKKLFRAFTGKFGDIYGNENSTYSSHSIIHVTDDVERFGVFDNYSAFPGESNLGFLKGLVRGGNRPLQQVIKTCRKRFVWKNMWNWRYSKYRKGGFTKRNIVHEGTPVRLIWKEQMDSNKVKRYFQNQPYL